MEQGNVQKNTGPYRYQTGEWDDIAVIFSGLPKVRLASMTLRMAS